MFSIYFYLNYLVLSLWLFDIVIYAQKCDEAASVYFLLSVLTAFLNHFYVRHSFFLFFTFRLFNSIGLFTFGFCAYMTLLFASNYFSLIRLVTSG